MKKIIVNADDFGISKEVNEGIVKGFQDGIISSTTVMANMPEFEEAMNLAKKNSKLGVGVHLNVIDGKALAIKEELSQKFAVKSILGLVKRKTVEEELMAQVEKVVKHIDPSHLDVHQHQGVFPNIREAVVNVAKEYKIKKIRLPKENAFSLDDFSQLWKKKLIDTFIPQTKRLYDKNELIYPEQFFGILSTGSFNVNYLESFLKKLKKNGEIMVHPGFYSKESPLKGDFLVESKHKELNALISLEEKELLKKYNVKKISFKDL